jgi:glycosyltransferase involved in cell wall biosynthesis
MTAISVVVPAFNSARTLRHTLEALGRQRFDESYEVIVVDDGSTDETPQLAASAGRNVIVVRQRNRGAAVARNRGAAESRAPLLAFTDADCVPDPDWLREGVAGLADADLVQGAVSPDPTVTPMPFDRTLWVERESGLYEAANLFVRRELFERLGGFERLVDAPGRPLGEDVWFGWRARRAGARTSYRGSAVVHHAVTRRRATEYIRERRRRAQFAPLARKVPELRDKFFYRRVFLSRRTAAFDLAALGAATAAALRSPLPLAVCGPYAWLLTGQTVGWRRHAAKAAAVEVAADAVSFGALVTGSIRWRAPVL